MERIKVTGTKTEVIKTMKDKGYHMEGFNKVSIKARYFYAYKVDYQGADYFTIAKSGKVYTLTQYSAKQ